MTADRAAAYTSLAVFAIAGFFVFPGHTILQSDTQIYVPILEHLWDPSILSRDPIATQPHVAFTLYDEIALSLRRLTGAPFELILMVQQFVYRLLALFGCYLLARAVNIERSAAVLVAGIAGLGATISGPAVLSIEYEPVPRGFALAWILLGFGLVAQRRWTGAGVCTAIALLFHPNTALPVWTLVLLLTLIHRQWRASAVLTSAALLLAFLASMQSHGDAQPLFGRISPELEALQRLRASYSWVSIWIERWWLHYLLLWAAAMAAYWRTRQHLSTEIRVLFVVLSTGGLVSIPVSYALTEQAKWILMPQFQPGRYLVYTALVCVLATALAGIFAARAKRWAEAVAFFSIAFAVPLAINLGRPAVMFPLLLPAALAGASARARGVAASLVVLAATFAYPNIARVRNYSPLHSAELDSLARWARTQTPPEALFQFAGVGRGLEPGVFRARSLRALYADWKSGGQVNFLPRYAEVWRRRWADVEKPLPLDMYRDLGIDYVVYRRGIEPRLTEPVYSNPKWKVYRVTLP